MTVLVSKAANEAFLQNICSEGIPLLEIRMCSGKNSLLENYDVFDRVFGLLEITMCSIVFFGLLENYDVFDSLFWSPGNYDVFDSLFFRSPGNYEKPVTLRNSPLEKY
jgi:hypothetical protein